MPSCFPFCSLIDCIDKLIMMVGKWVSVMILVYKGWRHHWVFQALGSETGSHQRALNGFTRPLLPFQKASSPVPLSEDLHNDLLEAWGLGVPFLWIPDGSWGGIQQHFWERKIHPQGRNPEPKLGPVCLSWSHNLAWSQDNQRHPNFSLIQGACGVFDKY